MTVRVLSSLYPTSFPTDSAAALESTDDKWLVEVDNSRWLQNVSRCLDVARMAVLEIEQGVSVVLKGKVKGRQCSQIAAVFR